MNKELREAVGEIHQLVSKAKSFENQLRPLAELYTQVQGMVEQLNDLNTKVLSVQNNINSTGLDADELRDIIRNQFSYVDNRELLEFEVDEGSVYESFSNNAEREIEINDCSFNLINGNEIELDDYQMDTDSVDWKNVADDIQFEASLDHEKLEEIIDLIVDKACPPSHDDIEC